MSEEKLSEHNDFCERNYVAKAPKKGSYVEFKDHNKRMKVPFVIYADFESFIVNDVHVPSSYCYYLKSFDKNVLGSKFEIRTIENVNEDIALDFVNTLRNDAINIGKLCKANKRLVMKPSDLKDFENANKCHICKLDIGEDKVKDHCHLTGKYRGAAHNDCNINFNMPKFLPVFFHNLSGYDAHLFVTKIEEELTCIPHTEEKYIIFSSKIKLGEKWNDVFEIRFLDSFKFMGSSLDALAKCITDFKILNTYFDNSEQLTRKGVYPYEWVNLERMNATNLPPMDCFYSKLSGCGISETDYEHAMMVWNVFGCTSFREYHDIYNLCDVLILVDIFENFRDVCYDNYGLDPAWYYTSPGLSWSAMLKMTKVK